MNKYGVQDKVKEPQVPVLYKETGPGIHSRKIGFTGAIPAKERLHASKPWIPKGGRAKEAVKAHAPKGAVPTKKVGKGAGYDDPKGYTKPVNQKKGYTKI